MLTLIFGYILLASVVILCAIIFVGIVRDLRKSWRNMSLGERRISIVTVTLLIISYAMGILVVASVWQSLCTQ